MTAYRIVTVVGARPQFVKAAPVSRALAAVGLQEIMVHTGQHFDAQMSDVFFHELGIPQPTHQLAVHSLSHGAMTGRMLEQVEAVLLSEKPDMVLVYGDTNSTLAGALAAAKLHIPVAHVEAGLRSHNQQMPEEINRILTDRISALLFCPTTAAVEHLRHEGITQGVHAVGDVMFDITLQMTQKARDSSHILETCGLTPKSYAVCTIHRAENTDDPRRFAALMEWLANAAQGRTVVMPVHPRTQQRLREQPHLPPSLRCIDPLGYADMTWLVHHAAAVFTDSGGLQKEAYFHRVPCVTLRDETEWVETIAAGWNRLWTVPDYQPRGEITEYGKGQASQDIAQQIKAYLAALPAAK